MLSHTYLCPPPILAPSLPCFHDDSGGVEINTDIFGSPFGPTSPKPPITPGTTQVANQISSFQCRVMHYNASPRGAVGDEMDMRVRNDLLLQLAALEATLPPHLRHRENLTPQTIYLK